jgi:hypothetical protein
VTVRILSTSPSVGMEESPEQHGVTKTDWERARQLLPRSGEGKMVSEAMALELVLPNAPFKSLLANCESDLTIGKASDGDAPLQHSCSYGKEEGGRVGFF